FYDMLFEKLGPEDNYLEVEYVTVPGVGKKVNYSSIDVEGKIALVKRGDTTFEEKAAVALAEGAIGCIIYNNVAGDVFMNAGQGLQIALSSISMDDGEYLAAKPSGTLILDKSYLAGPFMSEFSSWGPVSDLSLKPEITAHGGSILSAVPGGGYEEISGTSMACPNLCGVVILVRQALKERYKDITSVELTMLTNQLLMSTGTIIYDETGNPYSPRKQGAGLGNLQKALDTLAYLSVGDTAKSKLDLGDDPKETGEYELVFDINNISDKELTYNLTNYTMTESLSKADPKYVAQKAYMLNPETTALVTGDGSINGDVITVNPNGKVTVKYTLKLTKQEIKYIQKSFVNGMYVEGFAVLESLNEDAIDLSIPFLAFFGDWTVAPMFDKTYYEVESEAHNGSIDEEDKLKADYYATTPLGTYYYSYIIPLGTYVYEMDESKYDPIPATEEHAAIGYSLETINGITTVYAGLLRNAKKMTTVIKNSETGEVVYEHIKYDEHKAYFYGQVVPGYDLINITAAELGLQNNTKYTFSMQAELDYDDGGLSDNLRNTFEFSFYVDYESPVITDTEFYHKYDKSAKEYRYYVDVYVYDNHYAQSIRPFTIIDGKLTSLVDYVIPIYSEERGGISKVTVEITDYMDLLQYGRVEGGEHAITNGLGFLVDDYALNQNYCYVTLPGTNSTNITYKPEYVSGGSNHQYTYLKRLTPGDVLDLTYMLTSDDPVLAVIKEEDVIARYFATLEWKSSNENVVKVKNGKIEAVGQGQAKITCTTMHEGGDVASTTLVVNVRAGDYESDADKLEDIKFTYFDTLKAFTDGPETSEIGATGDRLFFTEKPYISFYPSEKVQLGYELEPWNLSNYELVWASTNEKVATVDENGVVTALKAGKAVITATANGISASCTVNVVDD
ncbi:MAG: S8 family serine peptidase, partial [Acholeplasmatales bacterium]|nr:S8 family serine peptidase [Acholeplasmatales bacterium]